jgi:hypothetical protein
MFYLTVYLGSLGMQEERRKESHTQGGYYLSVADCIYFGSLEASCLWLSSCVLVLGLEIQEHKNQRKVYDTVGSRLCYHSICESKCDGPWT